MIKAVVLDFDGELTVDKTGSASITQYLSQAGGSPLELVQAGYAPYNKQLLGGNLTHQDMWPRFCRDLGQPIDYAVLLDAFRHTALEGQMIDLVKRLKKDYAIAIVTDNKADRVDTILQTNGLEPYFDVVAVSARLHTGKDSADIFEYVLRTLKAEAEACVFVDNTAKDLRIPHQMGMKTILFDDENRDREAFRRQLTGILAEGK